VSPPRFFVALDLAAAARGDTLALPEAAAHHAIRVARLSVGDALTLFDGSGGEWAATIARVDRRGAAARLERHYPVERESPLAITLAQCVAASDAMDYAVRKATELGARAIQPLASARSAPRPDGARADRRRAHWRQVAIAACEQCGRNRLPEVRPQITLAAWLDEWNGGGIVLDPRADGGIASLAAPAGPIAVLIGPEGGLDADEIERAKRAGFVAMRLGPRTLRTETAGAAVIAALGVLWGDF
jgi:16S rRNA (uracil1498-N3)-methyltransferase